MTKEQRQLNGVRMVFSANGTVRTGHPRAKKKKWFYLQKLTQNESHGLKGKSIKHPEDNRGDNLGCLGLAVSFYFYLFMVALKSYVSFRARDRICSHSDARSFYPLCWARDQTRASAVTQAAAVRFLTHWATARNPWQWVFRYNTKDMIHERKSL